MISVFHHLAQLPSRFCQIPISPRRIGQTVERTKYKSTRPSPRADGTPCNFRNFTIPTLCNEFITGGGFCWSCRFAILHCGRAQRKDLNKSIRVSMDTRNSNFLFPFRVRVSVALLNQFCPQTYKGTDGAGRQPAYCLYSEFNDTLNDTLNSRLEYD